MANFSALKQAIQNNIKQNGNKEITGNLLQTILLSMVTTMGDGAINDLDGEVATSVQFIDGKIVFKNAANTIVYQLDTNTFLNDIETRIDAGAVYAGYATPSTTPAALTGQKVFYVATQAGTYTHFHFNGGNEGITLAKDGVYFIESGLDADDWNATTVMQLDDVPTPSSNNAVKSGGVAEELALGAVYDVSAKNPTAGPNNDGKWESLSALLSDANLNTIIPTSVRKGGMSIKFVHSIDNKYVQYRYMGTETTGSPNPFLDTANWQGVVDEIIADSDNLPSSMSIPNYIYGAQRLDTYSIVTGCYLAKLNDMTGDFIRINKSSTSDNKVCFIDIEDVYKIEVRIPKASTAGSTNSVTLAYSSEALDSGSLSGTIEVDGKYILDAPASSGTNIQATLFNTNNAKYLVVCYNGVEPITISYECDTVVELSKKIDKNAEDIETLGETLGQEIDSVNQECEEIQEEVDRCVKYKIMPVSAESVVSGCYLSSQNNNVQVRLSSQPNNKVAFFPIPVGHELDILIPKASTSGLDSKTLAYSSESMESQVLSVNTNLTGEFVQDAPPAQGTNIEAHIIPNTSYTYLIVGYYNEIPVVTYKIVDEDNFAYQEISGRIEANGNRIDIIEENISNYPILTIPCGSKYYEKTNQCRSCHIDGEYSYVGHNDLFYKYKRDNSGNIERLATISLGEGSAYAQTVTGIKTDENFIYIVTRDYTGGLTPPASGIGGYLMIFNKTTLEKVSETILVDSLDPVYKGMQCYIYKENYLIIPLQLRGWCVYDISNKLTPTLVNYYGNDGGEYQHCDTWSDGNVDYVAFSGFNSHIKIYDITNIDSATLIAETSIIKATSNECFGIKVLYPYLYLTIAPRSGHMDDEDARKGIMYFNISKPSKFAQTRKIAVIPRQYWGTSQDGDGQPNYMGFFDNVILVNLDNVGLGVFSAIGDDVKYIKTIKYENVKFRPIDVSEDGLFLAASDNWVSFYRLVNLENTNYLLNEIKALKKTIATLVNLN